MKRQAFAVIGQSDLARLAHLGAQQQPVQSISPIICIDEMAGLREFVKKLEDPDELTLTWAEILARLEPGSVVFKLVEADDLEATDGTEPVTIWVKSNLLPTVGPEVMLNGRTFRAEDSVGTHDAGSEEGFDKTDRTPFRLIRITADPEAV